MVSILVPSRDAAPRQDSAGANGVPHTVSGAAAPIRQQDGLLAPPVGSSASSIGNLFYLASVGLVAAGTVAVFFGIGFSLLVPSARGIPPLSAVRAGLEAIVLQPPVRTADQAASTDPSESARSSAVLPPSGEGSTMPNDAFASQARAEAAGPPAPEPRSAGATATAVPSPDAVGATTLAPPSSASS